MQQTVLASSAGQALKINGEVHALGINTATAHADFQPAFESVLIDNRYYKPLSIFKYGDRVKVSFGLRQPYAAHYILTKGLIEFHRSGNFIFDYNRVDRSFHVSVKADDLSRLRSFLDDISVWLDEEIYFKSALKEIISFEKQYKAKMQEVYALQSAKPSPGKRTGA